MDTQCHGSARTGRGCPEIMVFLIYGKVTLSSVTQYIKLAVCGGPRVSSLGGLPGLLGCFIILANGLRFQSSEAVCGSWLARVLTGRSGGAVLKHFLQCTLLSARMTWLFDALTVLPATKSAHVCLHMGCNVEMWGFLANGYRCAINYWSDSITQSCDCALEGFFIGPDFTLRGGGCVLQCVRVEYKARQDLHLLREHLLSQMLVHVQNRLGTKCHLEQQLLTTGQAPFMGVSADSYLVDPASSHMLVSKIKPCMSKYKPIYTVKLRMAH